MTAYYDKQLVLMEQERREVQAALNRKRRCMLQHRHAPEHQARDDAEQHTISHLLPRVVAQNKTRRRHGCKRAHQTRLLVQLSGVEIARDQARESDHEQRRADGGVSRRVTTAARTQLLGAEGARCISCSSATWSCGWLVMS